MRRLMRAAAAAFVGASALAVSTPVHAGAGTADIAATMRGPATASVGQTVSYGVQVTNGGPDAATGIEFTATLSGPGQYTLNIPGPTAKCTIRGSTISCEVGGINIRGGSVVFDVGITMTGPGTVVQNFTATVKQTDPNPSNNSGTVTTMVS
jgi:uncharacterized repeat protein (TIGR01451 family)